MAVELPATLQAGLAARRGPPAGDVRHLLPGRRRRRGRPRRLRARRAGRPVHRGHPHGARNRRRGRLRRSRRRRAARTCRTPTPTPTPLRRIGLDRSTWRPTASIPQPRSEEIARHADGIAWKLQGADPLAARDGGGLAQPARPGARRHGAAAGRSRWRRPRREGVRAAQPAPGLAWPRSPSSTPTCSARYEQYRAATCASTDADRPAAARSWPSSARPKRATKPTPAKRIAHWQRRLLARYTRNLALAGDQLTAGPVRPDRGGARRGGRQLRLGGLGSRRHATRRRRSPPTCRRCEISGEEVWLDTRKIRLRRRLPGPKRRLRPVGLKPRKKEKFPGEWASQLDGNAICSYPPEDLVIEDYGRFLKKKGKSILSEERARVEPFTTSILDGIDMRETIRNWHEGRIYVRAVPEGRGRSRLRGRDLRRGPRATATPTSPPGWARTRTNRDMAFYSTFPFDNLVGPGIGRAEYGGFLMTLPPRRMFDVWQRPGLRIRRNQSRAPAAGGPGLLDRPLRGLRGRQAAALHLPHHRRAPRTAPSSTSPSASFRPCR